MKCEGCQALTVTPPRTLCPACLLVKVDLTWESLVTEIAVEGDCWLWQGYTTEDGEPVHRVGTLYLSSATLIYGMMTEEAMSDDLAANCGNENCVSPIHQDVCQVDATTPELPNSEQ